MSTQPPVLKPECEDFLHQFDLYAVQNQLDASQADIYDCDGDRHFSVPKDVGVNVLVTIVHHGKNQYERGRRFGNEHLAVQIRNLIGAAPAQQQA
jgi:hypothetical protein